MTIAIIIDAVGETVAHKLGCSILSSEAATAQGPAGVFEDLSLLRDFEPEEFAALYACECLEGKDGKDGKATGESRRAAEEVHSAGSLRRGNGGGDRAVDGDGDGGRRRSAGLDRSTANGSSAGTGAARKATGSLSKPERFAADAKEAGWDPEISHNGLLATVTARRGAESITITWKGEACQDGSMYRHGSYARTLRNAAACRRQLLIPADAAKPPASRVKRGKRPRYAALERVATVALDERDESEDEDEPYRGYVPFDKDSPDQQIVAAVVGKQLFWKSSIDRMVRSASVMDRPDQRQLKVERNPRNNKRILTFAAADQGFRSVYIESIIDVR